MSSILPSVATTNGSTTGSVRLQTEKPYYKRTFVFDFDAGEFVLDTMHRVRCVTDGREVLVQIVDKILHDERYKHLVYTDAYGNELKMLIAQDYPRDVLESELKRIFTEALVYHPLIEDVHTFSFSGEGDKIYCSFTVVGVNEINIRWTEEVAM